MTQSPRFTFSFAIGFVMASVFFANRSASSQSIDVWFGTATSRGSDSQGIYHSSFNTKTGKLTRPTLAAACNGPGFLALHPNGSVLYSTGSPDAGSDRVSAYRVSGEPGNATLELISSVGTGDGEPAHLSTNHAGTLLFSAQYGGGSTSMYALADDGAIERLVVSKEHDELLPKAGSGVVANRQEAPHAHWSGTSPDDRFLFVPDLGMDRVVIWKVGAESSPLTFHGFGVCPPGGGPRHMKFSPDEKKIYVLNELALSVTVFDYNAEQGTMNPVQTIQTLSDEVKNKELTNSASEIRVHPSGRFVYSANRGHDSISSFRVDDAGKLSLLEVVPIRGAVPRNFGITPDGKWIIAAGQDSNTVSVFSINEDTGELTFARETKNVPTPICVQFRAKAP
jgi:6-phosphogluconolactonase